MESLEQHPELMSESDEVIATEEEVQDLEEKFFERTGISILQFELHKYFEVVDVGGLDEEQGIVFVTVAFTPPPTPRDKDPIGEGKFHLTFRLKEGELTLVDYLAEAR